MAPQRHRPAGARTQSHQQGPAGVIHPLRCLLDRPPLLRSVTFPGTTLPTSAKEPTFMTLTDQLTDYVHAAFSGLWILTHEPDEAEREVLHHARQQQWNVAVWDVALGLRLPHAPETSSPETGAGDPLAAL